MNTKQFGAVLMGTLSLALTASAVAPADLTVSEGFQNPLGFHDATPTFSWKLPAGANIAAQSAYRIVAASKPALLPDKADLWDTGKVESDQSAWVLYGGEALASRQQVTWQVRFWDGKGNASDWSEPAHFELGLLRTMDWRAKWIRVSPTPRVGSADTQKVEIVVDEAFYGVPTDKAKQVDVTETLRKLIAGGGSVVEATNDMAGRDPAYGTVKSLTVKYRINGTPRTVNVKENDSLDLVTGQPVQGSGSPQTFAPEYLRKEFAVAGTVRRARLYVTARGLFEAYINGAKVGSDVMTPGWTPYHKRIETLTYDVTDQLRAGNNALGAILGEGWYAGGMMGQKVHYPQINPELLLQLEINYADGKTQTVATGDDNWKGCRQGPIRSSNIYHGEAYDARLEMPGWSEPGFSDTSWLPVIPADTDPAIHLTPKRHQPVRRIEELATIALTEPVPGRFVFDLGQNMVGWPRLTVPVAKDQTVTVRFAEMLQKDGQLYTANYRSARSTDTYAAKADGVITWEPTFTFHGFRYVELSGLAADAKPEGTWVTGVVLHSQFEQTGTFTSSHAKLNQLQKNIMWGQRGNFLDIPTDCPQRNERLGWTGDAQVFCPTSLFNYDVHAFWASWLESARNAQDRDGCVPDVIPNTLGRGGKPGWADAATVVPWEVYVRTGDVNVLAENYGLMKGHVGYYESKAKNDILEVGMYGDWLQPYPGKAGNKGNTPAALIGTAYWARSTDLTARAATVLGRTEEAARYADQFDKIKAAFMERFFDASGKLTTNPETQTGYLLALGFNLLPRELRRKANTHLAKQVEAADGHLRTGFLGTPLLAPVLDRFGRPDMAYGVLLKETYPSWFFSINQGATTMWERWNSYSHDQGFGNAGMNSFNHYAYGAIGQWMYERIAGLAPDPWEPGYKHFYIQPNPGGPLTSASAELETSYGRAKSAWQKTQDGLTLDAVIPPNTTATVIFPQGDLKDVTVNGTSLNGSEIILAVGDNGYGLGTAKFPPGTYRFVIKKPLP